MRMGVNISPPTKMPSGVPQRFDHGRARKLTEAFGDLTSAWGITTLHMDLKPPWHGATNVSLSGLSSVVAGYFCEFMTFFGLVLPVLFGLRLIMVFVART
jgi:hypothetical protein